MISRSEFSRVAELLLCLTLEKSDMSFAKQLCNTLITWYEARLTVGEYCSFQNPFPADYFEMNNKNDNPKRFNKNSYFQPNK